MQSRTMTKLNVKEWSSKLVGKKIVRDRSWFPTNVRSPARSRLHVFDEAAQVVSTKELPAMTRFKGGSFDEWIWDDAIRSDRYACRVFW
jgi:hypothetical protein